MANIIDANGKADFAAAQALFKTEIFERASEVDPSNSQDWFSLTLGWALAKGMSPDEAHSFSIHIRYHTELG